LIEINQTREFSKDETWWEPMKKKLMLKRIDQPEEVAHAAVFLVFDEASFISMLRPGLHQAQ
jgi:NAD(P)-dependent dehydrogenase (short-subunit alcohol dehydrogenase family)